MSPEDDPFSQLSKQLDELRATLSQLRATLVSGQKPVALSDLLRSEKIAAARSAAQAQKQSPGAKVALLAQTADAKLTAVRAALRALQIESSKLEARLERAEREAWQQKGKRAEATAKLNDRERLLQEIQASAVWKAVKPLWKATRRAARTSAAAPLEQSDFAFEFDAPSRWETRSEILFIKGWCLSRSGREIAAIRAKIGKKGRMGRYGLEREDVAAHFEDSTLARHSGFTIEVPVPSGTSTVQLEAIVQGGNWEPFFRQEVRREKSAGRAENAGADSKEKQRERSAEIPRLSIMKAVKAVEWLAPKFREHAASTQGEAPLFSILTPTFNTQPKWFAEAAISLVNQSFGEWEWCIVDDGSTSRETITLLEQLKDVSPRLRIKSIANSGISAATNAALELARGEFVCFLDHDDLLSSDALETVATQLLRKDFDVVYSDEDKLEDGSGKLVEPFFKPDWSPEYFRGVMYVGHLLCVRRELAQRVGFDSAFDGVQDFEFMLRVSEQGARIGHVPQVLYHWRKTPGSIAEKSDAKPQIDALQARAVRAHLQRIQLPATAEASHLPHRLRIVPAARADQPRVSIIIPTKDSPELLEQCLLSLYEKSSHPNFEVILIDNETTDPAALEVMARYPVQRLAFAGKFNFSRANNMGVRAATGSLVVFLNNDTEIIAADWLQHLAYYAEQEDVGAAGALLLYADGTVQHAGVALGMRGTADHTMRGFPPEVDGYAGSLACAREVSAVTAACMMMRKEVFEEVGGFNEHFFTAYQDVDLCLRLRALGLRLIFTPRARVVHHESASRKTYYDMVDRMLLLDRWEEDIEAGDPYYNRNFDLKRGDYSVAAAR